MNNYPVRPLELPPIGRKSIGWIVAWLYWCRVVDDAFTALIGHETGTVFTPVGAAWTSHAIEGGPVLLAGIDASGTAVFAVRSDLLDAEGMRVLHATFGKRYHSAPPHDLRVVAGWEQLWQTIEVPPGRSDADTPRLDAVAYSDVEACLLDPEWAVAIGIAESREHAASLRPEIGAALAALRRTQRQAPEEGARQEPPQSGLPILKRTLVGARQVGAEFIVLEMVRTALRVKVGTASGLQNLPGEKDPGRAKEVMRLVRESSGLSEDEDSRGTLSEALLGAGTGFWQVRAIIVDGAETLRLTPSTDTA